MTKKLNEIRLRDEDMREYLPTGVTMFSQDFEMEYLKRFVFNSLQPHERNIILAYAECASQRQIGKALGISTALANKVIRDIQKKIRDAYSDKYGTDSPVLGDGD